MTRGDAAKVLRPRPVDRAVDDDVSDLPGAQLLRVRRKCRGRRRPSPPRAAACPRRRDARRSSRPCADPAPRGPPCWRGRRAGSTPNSVIATVLPFRSRIARTRSVPNSSKHPTCTPPKSVMGSPASSRMTSGATKCRETSTSPDARAFDRSARVILTYLMSLNPSAFRSSVTMYWGATQMLGNCAILSLVVSGGGSPEACPGGHPSSPTVPATPRRRSRLVIIPSAPSSAR